MAFRVDAKKFTNILVELGIHKIRMGHKKPLTPSVNTPPPVSEEPASSCNYRIDPNGTKIWGGKRNNNPPPAPATKPVENNQPNVKNKPRGTTQEDLEKIFGKAAFF